MSNKPVGTHEAQLEIFLAWCALDSLKARFASAKPGAEHPDLFVQPIAESIADVEAALKKLHAFVAQQAPHG